MTRFCKYPEKVEELPDIGGYVDPDYESIVSLEPDFAVLLKEQEKLKAFLEKQGVEYLETDNSSLEDIIGSIREIGRACGRTESGDSIAEAIKSEMVKRGMGSDKARPSVLICVQRDGVGSKRIRRVYGAGANTFYTDLIEASGGRNVVEENIKGEYPIFSAEGVISLNPDIIIDITSSMGREEMQAAKSDWEVLTSVEAVKMGRIYSVVDHYITVPGPRILLTLRKFKSILSPLQKENG